MTTAEQHLWHTVYATTLAALIGRVDGGAQWGTLRERAAAEANAALALAGPMIWPPADHA